MRPKKSHEQGEARRREPQEWLPKAIGIDTDHRKPVEVSKQAGDFEGVYRLPMLRGSPRQIAWGRIIRHEFLSELLPKIIDASAELTPEEAIALFDCVDELRNLQDSRHWIEVVRHHRGSAVEFAKSLPAQVVAQRKQEQQKQTEKAERLKRAADGRKIAKEADAFAEKHGLPRMDSESCSQPQESLGRRCRHQLLSKLSETELAAVLPKVRYVDNPGVWIGATHQDNPLQYVLDQAAKLPVEQDFVI